MKKQIIYCIFVISLLATLVGRASDSDLILFKRFPSGDKLIIFNEKGTMHAIVVDESAEFIELANEKLVFKHLSGEKLEFAIYRPRPSQLTFVSSSLVESAPKKMNPEIQKMLRNDMSESYNRMLLTFKEYKAK